MAAALAALGTLRPLTCADAAEVAALIRRAFAVQPVATDPPSSALRETGATIASAIERGGGAGIEASGRLAGAVLWHEQEGGLYLGRLSVEPAWRGRGLARRLVAAAEAEAVRRGLPRVYLKARLVLHDNRRLFAACGYAEGILETHAGYAAPTTVIMTKILPVAGSGCSPCAGATEPAARESTGATGG